MRAVLSLASRRRGARFGWGGAVVCGVLVGMAVASAQGTGRPVLHGGAFESGGGSVGSANYGVDVAAGQSAIGDISGGRLAVGAGTAAQPDACPAVPGVRERQGCDLAVEPVVVLHVVDHARIGECARRTGVDAPACDVPLDDAKVKVFDRNDLSGLVIDTQPPGSPPVQLTKNPHRSLYDDIFESRVANAHARAAAFGCVTRVARCLAGVDTVGDLLVIVRWTPEPARPPVYTGLPLGEADFSDTTGDATKDLATKDLHFYETVKRDGSIEYSGS